MAFLRRDVYVTKD